MAIATQGLFTIESFNSFSWLDVPHPSTSFVGRMVSRMACESRWSTIQSFQIYYWVVVTERWSHEYPLSYSSLGWTLGVIVFLSILDIDIHRNWLQEHAPIASLHIHTVPFQEHFQHESQQVQVSHDTVCTGHLSYTKSNALLHWSVNYLISQSIT